MASQPQTSSAFAPVLAALSTMQGNGPRPQKLQAHEYLEKFQKSSEAWNATHVILQSSDASPEAKMFAATTLKGKIIYDLEQLPQAALEPLRDSLIALLQIYSDGPRPIRTQVCVCLASLAVQYTAWHDVLPLIGNAVQTSKNGGEALLEFLRILPEEVMEGRKINMTEEQLTARTRELLEQNSTNVLDLLIRYSQSLKAGNLQPQLFECISSWLGEISVADVVNSPLLDCILAGLNSEPCFDQAVDCMCNIYRDTQDVDENVSVIRTLYPKITSLRPKILEAAETEDADLLKGVTRLFAEAGEAWVVLIARLPRDFKGLVEAILECCMRDSDRDAMSVTFNFWYQLKLSITSPKFEPARSLFADIYSKLVDIMIKHLEFPVPDNDEATDLFDGDREAEEKFREFRHKMGDVLKDCCQVIGITECLTKSFNLIQGWGVRYGSQVRGERVPHWQQLEAPLFSLRAMGRMVSPEESTVLPRVIPLIVTIPDHEKLKFQAIMALGRYTEWTSEHPENLEAQLNYVISGFSHPSLEVVQAAALAFKFLGADCQKLLGTHILSLHQFYEGVLDKLKSTSQEEVTEGVAAVISVQPIDKIYESLKMFCDPVMTRIVSLAQNASDDAGQKKVADHLQLITTFIQIVQPYVEPSKPHPAVRYCEEILPTLAAIANSFPNSSPILERICRCWRYMFISYRTAMAPLLPTVAQNLAEGFQASRQGCFLWATDAIIREFSVGTEYVDPTTSEAVFQFYEQQVVAFLRTLSDLSATEVPDVIDDFFRLATDAVRFYPQKAISSSLAVSTLEAAISALSLQQIDPLIATLQYIRDILSFGTEKPLISDFQNAEGQSNGNPAEIQAAVTRLLESNGAILIQTILTGMMFRFPEECYLDASAILLALFSLMPVQSAEWVQATLLLLPAGSLKAGEANALMKGLSEKMQKGDMRKVRASLQDFTNAYRRRNVAPREGLGRLEATRFRFAG